LVNLEVFTACRILRIFLRTAFWDKLTTPNIPESASQRAPIKPKFSQQNNMCSKFLVKLINFSDMSIFHFLDKLFSRQNFRKKTLYCIYIVRFCNLFGSHFRPMQEIEIGFKGFEKENHISLFHGNSRDML